MGEERTHVETDELRAWARGTRERSDRMHHTAADAGAAKLDFRTFGAINHVFGLDCADRVEQVLDKIRGTDRYLELDSGDAVAVAAGFDDVEAAQADRFTRGDGHA